MCMDGPSWNRDSVFGFQGSGNEERSTNNIPHVSSLKSQASSARQGRTWRRWGPRLFVFLEPPDKTSSERGTVPIVLPRHRKWGQSPTVCPAAPKISLAQTGDELNQRHEQGDDDETHRSAQENDQQR